MSRKRKNGNGNGNSNGRSYKELKPKTDGQHDYIRAMIESDIAICVGPAGTGKTACAVGLACEYLMKEKASQIVVSRPVVETGRTGLGFLPGDMEQKIHPYLVPVLEEMYVYLGRANTDNKIRSGYIKLVPLEYMRGYNFHQSFIILDEAQNATLSQIKMLLTRIGRESTVVLTGDLTQSDLTDDNMGLKTCIDRLEDTRGVSIIRLTEADIIRHSIIARILAKLG